MSRLIGVRGTAALAVLLFATALPTASATGQNPRDRALAWISDEAAKAGAAVEASNNELQRAKEAVAQAERARALARQYNDTAAEQVAQDALVTAHEAVLAAQDKISAARAREQRMKALVQTIVPGATGFAAEVRGDVKVMSAGKSRPWDGAPIVFNPGDALRTGPDSRAVVTLEGGQTLVLRGNTSFSFKPVPNANPAAPLLERAVGYLEHGVVRLQEEVRRQRNRNRFQVRTPTAVVAVRGTEFLLESSRTRETHFTPVSGEVELTGEKAEAASAGWWSDAPLRSLAEGAILATGVDERASAELTEGYKIALAPSTLVEARTSGGAPVYVLRQGKMRVWGSGAEAKLRFVTPNSVIAPRAREFEVSVGDGGLATITPLVGTLVVTSVRERLDWKKIKGWDD